MDFFSEKELVTQTGHEKAEWPLVIVKELIDNALDACEEAGIGPVIEVTADDTSITVKDNGPGLPESTLRSQLDFTVRASNREAYVSPCRGAQGNALKTLLPMPMVIDPDHGRFIVQAHGKRHVISCGADPISQRPVINDDTTEVPNEAGTEIRLEWMPTTDDDGTVIRPFGDADCLDAIMQAFALFNPHATFRLNLFGKGTEWKETDADWPKWKPTDPTSPHWYELQHLERLIGAYITHDRKAGTDRRLVSDLVAEFDGLMGSGKRSRVLEDSGLKRAKLSELVAGDHLDSRRIVTLLAAMQRHTRPVNPRRLGIIGEDHFRERFVAMGVKPESFRYFRRLKGEKSKNSQKRTDEKASFLPKVWEVAFGYLGPEADDHRRKILSGVNWSPAIKNPFRAFGATGEGMEGLLTGFRAGAEEPIVYAIHLADPRVEYADRGKSSLIVGVVDAVDILSLTKKVTKEWTKQRKAEERGRRARWSRMNTYSDRVSFFDVADEILPKGYAHASGDGRYTAAKRQFYYSCRDEFREQTGKEISSDYFSQTLIVKYMNRNPEETAHWKITASPRGTITIPNTGYDLRIPCGTIAVEQHLREASRRIDPFAVEASVPVEWPSVAEGQRYRGVMYIEKEGFDPQLAEAKIAERFDIAIVSCKGQSVVAARRLVDQVCRDNGGVPLFVAHDFDPAGFSICQRLTSVSDYARLNDLVKYEFQNDINVTDLGLRLEDVRKYDLKSERFKFRGLPDDAAATEAEREFLASGRRVELNALTAPQFIEWITAKLTKYLGRKRFVPADDILADAYRRALAVAGLNRALQCAMDSAVSRAREANIPKDLRKQLERADKPWDKAAYGIAAAEIAGEEPFGANQDLKRN